MMRKIKVALDVWKISEAEPTGVINLRRSFARACTLLSEEDKIALSYTGMPADKIWLIDNRLLNSANFQYFRIPGRLQKLIASLKFLPWGSAVAKSDIYHSVTEYPYINKRTQVIGTLIDFIPLRLPEYVPEDFTRNQLSWCHWAAQHPETRWIAISENTKRDALSFSCLNKDQIWVVDLCAEDDIFNCPPSWVINSTLGKYHLQQPYLLCVSDLNPRKNHLRLLNVWKGGEFADQGWRLALAGYHSNNPITNKIKSGEFCNISWLGYIPRDELIALYYGCEGFVYPSLYEGFGLPVVDAIVAGKAVLTSQNSPMAEMAGSGAICINPYDTADISRGLYELILDSRLRDEMADHNQKRRQYFSIRRFSSDLFEAYQSIHCSLNRNKLVN